MTPEPFSQWLSRTQLLEDPWWRAALPAADERLSRNGRPDGPGRSRGTEAIVACSIMEREFDLTAPIV
jgi:hypothetical protein